MTRTKKFLAALLALLMMIPVFTIASSAKAKSVSYKDKSLVVLGDSIGAGFGLRPTVEDTIIQGVQMGHGEFVEGSWPQIVRDTKKFSAFTSVNLSRTMWRTDEFLRLLDPAFEAELCEPENAMEAYMSDYMMFPNELTKPGDTIALSKEIEGAIKQADVLVISLGSNDILTASLAKPIMLPLYQVFGRQAALAVSIASEMRIRGLDTPEEWTKFALGTTGYPGIIEDVNQNTLQFFRNYEHLVDIIYRLNPKVKLYVFGISHPFRNMEIIPGYPDQFFMPLNEQVIVNVRNYMTKQSRHRGTVTYVDMANVYGYNFDYEVWPLFFYDFILDVHPTKADHAQIAKNLMNKM